MLHFSVASSDKESVCDSSSESSVDCPDARTPIRRTFVDALPILCMDDQLCDPKRRIFHRGAEQIVPWRRSAYDSIQNCMICATRFIKRRDRCNGSQALPQETRTSSPETSNKPKLDRSIRCTRKSSASSPRDVLRRVEVVEDEVTLAMSLDLWSLQ